MEAAILIEEEQKRRADKFNPAHIRPSAAGAKCMRQEAYRILHALHPNNPEFIPPKPEGKDEITGTARLGDIVERDAAELMRQMLNKENKRVFPQYELPSPDLTNIDGTPVIAHPDIYVPSRSIDIEIKAVSANAINRLPIKSHLDQLLLRLLWWQKSKKKVITGILTYFFRETYYAPGTMSPVRFFVKPVQGGFKLEDDTGRKIETFDFSYVKSIEKRLYELKEHVLNKTLPPRTESPYRFPCYVDTEYYTIECPWREKCWEKELEEEKYPGVMVEKAAEIIKQYAEIKEELKKANFSTKMLKEKAKKFEEKLVPYFEEFGNKISAGGYTVKRAQVTIPEKTIPGYSYFRYSIKKQF